MPSKGITVRILLNKSHMNPSWKLCSEKGFWLVDPRNEYRRISVDATEIVVSQRNGRLAINGRLLTRSQVIVKAREGELACDGLTYKGSFFVAYAEDTLSLINCLDLEDYVFSVLYWEGWPGWSLEVNKVLAIAIRTYAVAMMCEAVRKKRPYHMGNSVAHQVYAGVHGNNSLRAAVEQTDGIVMTYRGQPILAMYTACCGGVVPARVRGVDFTKAPYLARTRACAHCKGCRAYTWTAEYEKDELARYLKKHIPRLSRLKSVYVAKKDAAGLVEEVGIKSDHGVTSLAGKKVRMLPNIKSSIYSIKSTSQKIVFKGCGNGHHVGLCQWGACKMVCGGSNYREVLDFYYPGTSLMKIS